MYDDKLSNIHQEEEQILTVQERDEKLKPGQEDLLYPE
jgi:hypothetical protein